MHPVQKLVAAIFGRLPEPRDDERRFRVIYKQARTPVINTDVPFSAMDLYDKCYQPWEVFVRYRYDLREDRDHEHRRRLDF